jgi:hypothetical protein
VVRRLLRGTATRSASAPRSEPSIAQMIDWETTLLADYLSNGSPVAPSGGPDIRASWTVHFETGDDDDAADNARWGLIPHENGTAFGSRWRGRSGTVDREPHRPISVSQEASHVVRNSRSDPCRPRRRALARLCGSHSVVGRRFAARRPRFACSCSAGISAPGAQTAQVVVSPPRPM